MGDRGDDAGEGFRRLGEDPVYSSRVFSVARVHLVDPDGEPFIRDVVHHPGAVAVVPAHPDGNATLVRQLRVAAGGTVLEIPAGTCDVAGEELETTARRELAEEAGLVAARMERLITVLNSPGYSDQRTTVFLATGLTPTDTGRSGAEERWMTVERVPLAEVEHLAAQGTLQDSTTLVGLLLARTILTARGELGDGRR